MTELNRAKTELDPRGIDGKLIECLEAFEAWVAEASWTYDYESAKAGFMAAWLAWSGSEDSRD